MLAHDVVLEQRVDPRAMAAERTRIERLYLAEIIHVLLQAAPVAVLLAAFEAAKVTLAAAPDLRRQRAAE